MNILSNTKLKIASRPVAAVVGTWGLIMAVAYLVLSLQVLLQTESAKKSGIELIQQLSKNVGLPLLEKNMEQLQAALTTATQKPGVILSWVTDHQNTLVAITGNQDILPVSRPSDARSGDLEVWTAEASIPSPHLNLVAAVTYAGTRIGRVFMAIAPETGIGFKDQILRIAVFSGLLILALTAVLYHRQSTAFANRIADHRRRDGAAAPAPTGNTVACPLCGKPQALSEDIFEPVDSSASDVFSTTEHEAGGPARAAAAQLRLRDVGDRRDLSWVKRRILLRCADIIRILST